VPNERGKSKYKRQINAGNIKKYDRSDLVGEDRLKIDAAMDELQA
jgi:hypothetical protein